MIYGIVWMINSSSKGTAVGGKRSEAEMEAETGPEVDGGGKFAVEGEFFVTGRPETCHVKSSPAEKPSRLSNPRQFRRNPLA